MTEQAHYFGGEYRFARIGSAGHFLHCEQPAEVTRLLLDWPGKP